MIFFWFSDAAMASLMMAQTLVMVSTFYRSRHSLLMPWKLLQIGKPGRTVERKHEQHDDQTDQRVSRWSKESLDEIELSIWLDLAVATYGGYFQYKNYDFSTRTKWTKTSSECICYVDGIAMTAVPTWKTDRTQLLRSTLQCNTGFLVRKETEFPFRWSRLQQWGQSSEIPSRVFVVLDEQHS